MLLLTTLPALPLPWYNVSRPFLFYVIGLLHLYVYPHDILFCVLVNFIKIDFFQYHVYEICPYWWAHPSCYSSRIPLHESPEICPLLVDLGDVSSLGLLGKNAALNLLEWVSWCIYASKRLSWVFSQEWTGWEGSAQGLVRSREIIFPESQQHIKASVNPFFHTWHCAAFFVFFY